MIIATDIQVWADDLRDWVDMNPGPEPVVFMHVTAQGPYPWTSATQYFRNVTERYDRRDPAHSFQAHANTWIQDWVNANLGPGKWDILGRLIRVEPCPGPMRLTVLDRADWRRMNYIVLDQGRVNFRHAKIHPSTRPRRIERMLPAFLCRIIERLAIGFARHFC